MNIKIMMLLLGLIGCAPLPKVDSQAGSSSAIEHNPGKLRTDLTNAIARSSQHADSSLTEEILFDFLLAETALQRDRLDISAESYARLARITRDARIAERAADIALRTRQPALAQEAIDLWVTLEPQSQAAHQAAVILFIDVGQLNRARPHLEKLLASQPDAVGKSFQIGRASCREKMTVLINLVTIRP